MFPRGIEAPDLALLTGKIEAFSCPPHRIEVQLARVVGKVHQGLPGMAAIRCPENAVERADDITQLIVDKEQIQEGLGFPLHRQHLLAL
ncbi:hypothetical protein FQZ97_1054750 [compost metagenome]